MLLTLEPSFEEWPDILRAQCASRDERASVLDSKRVMSIRRGVVAEALQYTRMLASLACKVGVALPMAGGAEYQVEMPIVMAGHQPTIYHSGLFFKAQMLSRIVRETRALGVLVDIDTDVGDAGKLAWPRITDGRIELVTSSLTSKDCYPLYRSQTLGPQSQIDAVFKEMREDLVSAGLHSEAMRAAEAGAVYRALEGQPLAIANAIVRARFEAQGYLEVPLSRIAQDTELRELLRRIMQDSRHFSTTYNTCLDNYRREHKIKNQANPFPNVKSTDEGQELPLWRVSQTERAPVVCGSDGEIALKSGEFLVSRGSVTTMLLRGYCSDLFIHGLGGRQYDEFVDRFASEYLKITLPRFVVASETRYLFPRQVAETRRMLELASQCKETVSRTESFLGQGVFTEAEEEALAPLLEKRRELRDALSTAVGEQERSVVLHALNECNRRVRSVVESTKVYEYAQQSTALEGELERWSYREYPFFLFGDPPFSGPQVPNVG